MRIIIETPPYSVKGLKKYEKNVIFTLLVKKLQPEKWQKQRQVKHENCMMESLVCFS